jgi:hypothetical protein
LLFHGIAFPFRMRGLISAVLLLAPALASAALVPEVDIEQEWNQEEDHRVNGSSYNLIQEVYS